MTVEELLSKKISNEMDVVVLTRLLKGVNTPQKEIDEHVEKLRKNMDNSLERDLIGGTDKIHKED